MHIVRAGILRGSRDMEIYVLFVDLVQAYDTVNHALLFGILKKCGIPEELVEVVDIMYKDCNDHVQAGKQKITIDYLTGLQQGDDVEPLLFIYLMLAISETMNKDWKYKIPTFGHFKSNKWNIQEWTIEEPKLSDNGRSPGRDSKHTNNV
jgi:hypothetical protein